MRLGQTTTPTPAVPENNPADPNLTPAQRSAQVAASQQPAIEDARTAMARGRTWFHVVSTMDGQAREKKDVLLVICIEEKRMRIRTSLAQADQNAMKMEAALKKGEVAAAVELSLGVQAKVKEIELAAKEASLCVGEEEFTSGTSVKMEESTDLPTDDPSTPTYNPGASPSFLERPAAISPYR